MIMKLSMGQLHILADLCVDISKGMFLAGLAIPAVAHGASWVDSIHGVFIGIIFTFLSLKAKGLEDKMEVDKK